MSSFATINNKHYRMKNSLFWTGILLITFSCGVHNPAPPVELVEENPEEMVADSSFDWEDFTFDDYEEYEAPHYNPSRKRTVNLVHTKIEASFNWEESEMNGKATITMQAHSHPIDSVVLDAKGMEILDVLQNDEEINYDYPDGNILTLYLDRTYKQNENITVTINYVAKPEERETSGSAAITSDKGLYFINPKGEDENKMPQI